MEPMSLPCPIPMLEAVPEIIWRLKWFLERLARPVDAAAREAAEAGGAVEAMRAERALGQPVRRHRTQRRFSPRRASILPLLPQRAWILPAWRHPVRISRLWPSKQLRSDLAAEAAPKMVVD